MTDLDPDLTDLSPDLSSYQTGGGAAAPATCPDIIGPTTIVIVSIKGSSDGALFAFRQGDTQPPLTVQMLDGNGNPITLSGAAVIANFILPGQESYIQQSTMTVQTDGITAKYERQVSDFLTTNPGRYYIVVTARWSDGTGLSAPDTSEAFCDVDYI